MRTIAYVQLVLFSLRTGRSIEIKLAIQLGLSGEAFGLTTNVYQSVYLNCGFFKSVKSSS